MNTLIRIAEKSDLPRIVDIYNQAVLRENATADTEPVTLESRSAWFELHDHEHYPIYVHTDTNKPNEVNGWLSLSHYRMGRAALAGTAEVSYYVDYKRHGEGIASALLQHAIGECQRIRKRILFAILLEINVPSIRVLEKFGFEKWGHLPDVAEFSHGLCGHLYYGLKVGAGRQGRPS